MQTATPTDRKEGARPLGAPAVAVAIAAFATAILVWFAWKQGAYFESVFLPGAIFVFGLLIVLIVAGPFNRAVSTPFAVAFAALAGLAFWTLLSAAWSPLPSSALHDFEQVLLYAGLFALGCWCAVLAGRRLALLPLGVVAATGAVVGVVITVTLAGGTDVTSMFHDDATMRFPIGYRNAEAAFLLIGLWPVIALAAEGGLPWWARAGLIGVATMLLELAVLAQSRGSLPATVVALTVFLAVSPRRLRAATYLALAAAPVLLALPTLLDVFQHGRAAPDLVPLLRDAARAIALTSLASVGLAAVCIGVVEARLDLGAQRVRLLSWVTGTAAVLTVLIGGTIFVSGRGGPIDFVDQRIDEFREVGYPDLSEQGARFGANVGSNRNDFWRVAMRQGRDQPVGGGGAGSFAIAYLQDRRSGETPRDPHSVEMLLFGELGIVGLALFGTFVVAAAVGGLRTRRLGRTEAALAAGAIGSGGYWLTHSSYDWFLHYPALTAPVMFLLGAVAAPALVSRRDGLSRPLRFGAAGAFAFALLLALPLFASQRYANQAYDEFPADPDAAFTAIDRAADLDPFDPQPLLSRGLMAQRLGDEGAAAAAFREAIERVPEGYAGHYLLARTLRESDPPVALAEAEEALRLNPLDVDVRALARRLQKQNRAKFPENDFR